MSTVLPYDSGQGPTLTSSQDLSFHLSREELIQEIEIRDRVILRQHAAVRYRREYYNQIYGEDNLGVSEATKKALYDGSTCTYYRIDEDGKRIEVHPPSTI